MRKILFKGKAKDNDEWVQGYIRNGNRVEVISNIFNNPELLAEDNQ